mmetsp:Transcript_25927/g.46064  ORF Transcript_25927/g.46064 Transcript_25927/m.46064 type:complete len:214 (+) Transcript_25927:1055-1696(+)
MSSFSRWAGATTRSTRCSSAATFCTGRSSSGASRASNNKSNNNKTRPPRIKKSRPPLKTLPKETRGSGGKRTYAAPPRSRGSPRTGWQESGLLREETTQRILTAIAMQQPTRGAFCSTTRSKACATTRIATVKSSPSRASARCSMRTTSGPTSRRPPSRGSSSSTFKTPRTGCPCSPNSKPRPSTRPTSPRASSRRCRTSRFKSLTLKPARPI